MLMDMALDMQYYLGSDELGTVWFGKILPEGGQLWAKVRGEFILDAGINAIPKEYNPYTGLAKFIEHLWIK